MQQRSTSSHTSLNLMLLQRLLADGSSQRRLPTFTVFPCRLFHKWIAIGTSIADAANSQYGLRKVNYELEIKN
jgi:hypothetical protein